jgi:hypothetical protein
MYNIVAGLWEQRAESEIEFSSMLCNNQTDRSRMNIEIRYLIIIGELFVPGYSIDY